MKDLIARLAQKEKEVLAHPFIAPHLAGMGVATKVEGLVYRFRAVPHGYVGWGVFRARDAFTAAFEREASDEEIADYVRRLKLVPLILVRAIEGRTWLAVPVNLQDARQRLGADGPTAVHLVGEGSRFDRVLAAWDGLNLWFVQTDLFGAEVAAGLSDRFAAGHTLSEKEYTPEYRLAYNLAAAQAKEFEKQRLEQGLTRALEVAGASLRSYREKDGVITIEWVVAGVAHVTTVSKSKWFGVQSAGLCLSGGDRNYDLTALVAVVNRKYKGVERDYDDD